MAYFTARDDLPAQVCREAVTQAAIFVLIAGFRYGSPVRNRQNLSYTEYEFEVATEVEIPRLVFILGEDTEGPAIMMRDPEFGGRQDTFRERLAASGLTTATVTSPGELETALLQALTALVPRGGGGSPVISQPDAELSIEQRKWYVAALTRRYRLLELSTLAPQGADEQPVEITQVFVVQRVRADPPPLELPRDVRRHLLESGDVVLAELPEPEEFDRELLTQIRTRYAATLPRPVTEIIADSGERNLVLLGDPGAGKSTLLRYLTLIATTDDYSGAWADDATLGERLAGWLPVLVELRGYASPGWRTGSWTNGTVLDYLDYLHTQQGLGLPRDVLDGYMRADGRAMVMFDGLDELFDPGQREDTARRITAFAARYPSTRVIVTSRVIGYQRALWDGAGFKVYTLQDLERTQIEAFVHNWYERAYVTNHEDAQDRSTRLLAAIDRSAATRDLAGNPMLLTILAVIGRHRELPKERHRVYEHAVNVLTQYWDWNRAVRDTRVAMDYVDEEDKRELLRRIARRMQEDRDGIAGNRITHQELLREFESYFRERYQKPPDEARVVAKAMLEQFRDRNFILSRFGPGLYGFVHRALLEYCCADEIVYRLNNEQTLGLNDLVTEVFGVHAEDPTWQEVLLLIAGMINARFLGVVVDELLARTNAPAARLNQVQGTRLLMLALRCLSEARRINQLERQCTAAVRSLTAYLVNLTVADRSGSPQLVELTGVYATMRDISVVTPARETFRAWCRTVQPPDHDVRAAVAMAEAIGGILAALFGGEAAESEPLKRQLQADPRWQMRLSAATALVRGWRDERTRAVLVDRVTADPNEPVRRAAMTGLAEGWPDEQTRALLTNRATIDDDEAVREAAVTTLAQDWPDEQTRALLVDRLTADPNEPVRRTAVDTLARNWPDEQTRALLTNCANTNEDGAVRQVAMTALAREWPYEQTREQLTERATTDEDEQVRQTAVVLLARGWPNEQTRALLIDHATTDFWVFRKVAVTVLAETWPDEQTRALLIDRANVDDYWSVREAVLTALAQGWPDHRTRALLTARATTHDHGPDRQIAMNSLATAWPDEHTRALLARRATTDEDEEVRRAAITTLAQVWPDEQTHRLLISCTATDPGWAVRQVMAIALARGWPDEQTRELLADRATIDEHEEVRRAAITTLAQGWPDEKTRELLKSRVTIDDDGTVRRAAATALRQWWHETDDNTSN
jgi:hypothetical protein